jgi:hypothetical protein
MPVERHVEARIEGHAVEWLNRACHFAPERCHAEVLIELANR